MKKKGAKSQLRHAQRPASGESSSYTAWIVELKRRYRATQIKAAVSVNSSLIEFYWNLGHDIAERYPEANLGNEFYRQMSFDLRDGNSEAKGLSPQTLKYCGYFYRLYAIPAGGQQVVDLVKMQQVVAKSGRRSLEEIGTSQMGITNYQLKRILPTQAQLAKCYADAERLISEKRTTN